MTARYMAATCVSAASDWLGLVWGLTTLIRLAHTERDRRVGGTGDTHDPDGARQRQPVTPGNQPPDLTALPDDRRQFVSDTRGPPDLLRLIIDPFPSRQASHFATRARQSGTEQFADFHFAVLAPDSVLLASQTGSVAHNECRQGVWVNSAHDPSFHLGHRQQQRK